MWNPCNTGNGPDQVTRLGVQEGRAAVRRHNKVAAKATQRALGIQLLDSEQEGHALASWQLHGDRCIVDAILLLKIHVAAAIHAELARDLRTDYMREKLKTSDPAI